MDSVLLELSRKISEGDYFAAKRAGEHIRKATQDPKVLEAEDADRALVLLEAKCSRVRRESFSKLVAELRAIADAVEETLRSPVLLAAWIAKGEGQDDTGKRISNLLGYGSLLRETRRRVCGNCRGTSLVEGVRETCFNCNNPPRGLEGTIA